MFRKISIILFLIKFIPSFGQIDNNLTKLDLASNDLNGPVKLLVSKKYRIDSANDSILKMKSFSLLNLDGMKLIFNKEGNLMTKVFFDLRTDRGTDSLKWFYKYNSKSRILEENFIDYKRPKDIQLLSYQYQNDSLILSKRITKNHKVISTYEIDSNILIVRTIQNNSYKTKRLYQYDKWNRIIRYEDYHDKEFIQELHLYTFQDTLNDNIYKQINLYPGVNADISYSTKEYDKFGNPITVYSSTFNDNKIRIFKYVYKYDSHGNWIRREFYNQNNNLSQLEKRKITYFE